MSPPLLYIAAMSARVAFGVVTLRYVVTDFILTAPAMVVVFAAMMRSMRRSVRRRHSTLRMLAFAFLTATAAMAVVNLLCYALHRWCGGLFPPDPFADASVGFALASAVTDSLPLMTVWGGLFMLPLALRRAERHRAQVVAARREAELRRLRAHLEPHFVLNTLNTVAGLVSDDPGEARRVLGLLGDLFRDATSNREQDLHPLGDEIAWLERYAAIHEARHSRMVRFEWAVAASVRDALIPRLVLQPIVENAVIHGALRRRGGGRVRVTADVELRDGREMVSCAVEDDGPGFSSERRVGASGIDIVERRLALVGDDAGLSVAREDGLTRVTIRLLRIPPSRVAR